MNRSELTNQTENRFNGMFMDLPWNQLVHQLSNQVGHQLWSRLTNRLTGQFRERLAYQIQNELRGN